MIGNGQFTTRDIEPLCDERKLMNLITETFVDKGIEEEIGESRPSCPAEVLGGMIFKRGQRDSHVFRLHKGSG